jgi:acid phosphatase class B
MSIFTDYSGTLPEDPELLNKVLTLLQKLGEVFVITGRTKILLPQIILNDFRIVVIEEYGNPIFSGEIPNLFSNHLHFFYEISEKKYIIYQGDFSDKMENLIRSYGKDNFRVVGKIDDFTKILSKRNWRLLRSTQNIGYHNPKHRLYELFTAGKVTNISRENISLYIGNEDMDIPCIRLANTGIWVGDPVKNLPEGTNVVSSPEELYSFLNIIFTT